MQSSKLQIFGSALWVLLLCASGLRGQQLSLDEAVRTALRNNPGIKSAEYEVSYSKEVKKTGTDVGKLSALWMHGQYNSIYQDNNLTLQQTIPFPSTMVNQVKLGREQITAAQINLNVQQNILASEVKSIYFLHLYQEAQRKLLLSQDSLYSDFAHAAAARFTTGESNLLEKTTAETQLLEVKNLSRQNDADLMISSAKLKALLKSEENVSTTGELSKRTVPAEVSDTSLQNNPQLRYLNQEAKVSNQLKRVERSRIFPEIIVGGFVQSLTGVQNVNGTDVYFPRSKQFSGFQLGLAVPLWIRPNIARASAAGFQAAAMQKKAEHYQVNLTGNFEQALRELDKNTATIAYYETSALQNASLILSQSRKAFHAGEISYIEYLQALKISLGIKNNYLAALNNYNQSIVTLEYLLGKI